MKKLDYLVGVPKEKENTYIHIIVDENETPDKIIENWFELTGRDKSLEPKIMDVNLA